MLRFVLMLVCLGLVNCNELYFDTTFTTLSKKILQYYNQDNIRLVRDFSEEPTTETVEWTQYSRCGWNDCEEDYLLVTYYQDGDKSNPAMKVFVAKDELEPPSEFRTSGHKGLLHFGFLLFGEAEQALFYVLHPNSWGPYQRQFKTNGFTKFLTSQAPQAAAGAAAGAAVGSIIPGLGTIFGSTIGTLVSQGFSDLTDSYVGYYLRYIG